jgi:hypothetical protein
VVLLGILSFSPPVLAQASSSNSSDEADLPPKVQVQLLNQQLNHMREFDGRILDTVLAGFGSVVALALFVIGGSFVKYQLDKASLKQEMRNFIEQIVETKAKSVADEINSKIDGQIKSIQYEQEKLQAEKECAEHFYNNALMNCIKMTDLANELNDSFRREKALDYIQSILNKPEVMKESRLYTDITKCLNKLPNEYSQLKANILEQAKSALLS